MPIWESRSNTDKHRKSLRHRNKGGQCGLDTRGDIEGYTHEEMKLEARASLHARSSGKSQLTTSNIESHRDIRRLEGRIGEFGAMSFVCSEDAPMTNNMAALDASLQVERNLRPR